MARCLRLLGSLTLAVPLLVTIGGVLAWGTIYEARFGTAAVQRFIYQAWWFQALLAFLAVNLAAAAALRYPWKRAQAPFVCAHVGIILMLVGGIVGGRLGVEGQLLIPEGQANDVLDLPAKVLVVHQPNPGRHHVIPVRFETEAWRTAPNLTYALPLEHGPVTLTVDRYYPDAAVSEAITGGGIVDHPAVQVTLAHEAQEGTTWLLARDPSRSGVRWGDLHVLFLEVTSAAEQARWTGRANAAAPPRGTVAVVVPGREAPAEIPVPERLPATMALRGTPYRLTFKDYFPDFVLGESGPMSRSNLPHNPAVALTVTGPEGTDAYLLFAFHPEISALHGWRHLLPLQLRYRHGGAGALPPNAVALLQGPEETLTAVLTGPAGDRQVHERLAVGAWLTHPGTGYRVRVDRREPKVRVTQQVTPRSAAVRAEALHVVGRDGRQTAEAWVGVGQTAELALGAHPLQVEYRKAQRPLPFTVALADFRRIDYPGTQTAAGFEADVTLTDARRGVTLARTIRMNMPLKYRGYTLFQASYIAGEPETTVLAVRRDPGTPFVYAGFLIVLAGIILLFVQKPSAEKASAGTASADKASAGNALTRRTLLLPTLLLPTLLLPTLYPQTASAEERAQALPAEALATIRRVPIQHNGRVKPFDSFARETLQFITGEPRLGREDPVATAVSLIAQPDRWQDTPLLALPFRPLREALGFDPAAPRVSYNRLVGTRTLMRALPPIVEKQSRDEPLTMLEQETMDAYQRFVALSALWQQDLALVPPASGAVWSSILAPAGYPSERQLALRASWSAFLTAARDGPPEAVPAAAQALAAQLRVLNPAAQPAPWRVRWEILYNQIQPFSIAAAAYALAALALGLGVFGGSPLAAAVGRGGLWVAFVLHGAGIVSRVVLGGRPPVSNFYETMLWLPFVAVALALILGRIYRAREFGAAAALLAAIVLALAARVPLDPSLTPVVAVLRSHLWLTIHVLTVVASYGALALATVLAHLYGIVALRRRTPDARLMQLGTFLYRTIQVGVVLLAGGIMLGAVWANASWGRYWGWDPKETWALITLLWFLALLHGRKAEWLGGLGTAIGTIAGFFLLLMTYYGVSFYLVGLHSYAGGHAKPLPLLLVGFALAEAGWLALLIATASTRRPRPPCHWGTDPV